MRWHPPLSVGGGLGSRAPFALRKGRTPFVLRTFPPRVGETLVMRPSSDSCFRGNDGGWRGGFGGVHHSAKVRFAAFAALPRAVHERPLRGCPCPLLKEGVERSDAAVCSSAGGWAFEGRVFGYFFEV